MKNLLLIILSLTLVASADAQVSVRRTPKKEKKETKAPARTVSSPKKNANVPNRQPVLTDGGAPTSPATASPANNQNPPQTTPVKKAAEKKTNAASQAAPNQVNNSSLRRQLFDQNQPQPTNDARWQHIVYREIDLEEDANAALYYPQEPVDGLTNFFQIIFEALLKGDLKAYEYLDGREIFSEKYLVDIDHILQTQDIACTKNVDRNGKVTYVVEQSDIPSHLVTSYYIKEKWEVDKNTSQFRPHIIALCPVLHKLGDIGSGVTRYPLFWIDFNDLRPFINAQLIMTAEMNTAHRYTMDDFFALGMYKGEIYKVQNPRGLTLMQQYPDTAELRAKREEIENQLKNFGKSIYPSEEAPEEETSQKKPKKDKPAVVTTNDENTENGEEEYVEGDKKNRRTKKAVRLKKNSDEPKPRSVRRSR